jgi:uncharacterized protein YecE (DUF72 family)
MLGFYSGRFDTVEINNTFYRMPTPAVIGGWASQVPDHFRFVLKAPKRITHERRLVDVDEALTYFLNSALTLGERLGPLLFQLPPNFKKDSTRLGDFLQRLPASVRVAMEFRHASWFDDDVFGALRARGVALCIADTEDGLDTPFVATAPWGYMRLRDVEYSEADLRRWIDKLREPAWSEAYVFFKHEDEGRGPDFARRFMDLGEPS